MTLCIAAVSVRDSTIVTVSDMMLSTDTMSMDTFSVKTGPIGSSGRWMVLFAGDPTSFRSVADNADRRIRAGTESADEVVDAFVAAFQLAIQRKIEDELLSPYGFDRDRFFREGRAAFGDEEFTRVLYQINATKLDTDFLVAGFGLDKRPRIFSISDPGVYSDHTNLGFHAIGTGSLRACGALFSTYAADLRNIDLAYRLCEAKFLGESALGVGEKTLIALHVIDGVKLVYPEQLVPVREAWKRHGKTPIPEEACTAILMGLRSVSRKMPEDA